jgi:N-acetylglutamate synthase-like GNAT family acetyltransferase
MDPAQAQLRIKAQSSQQEKAIKADIVIENSSDLAKTWALVKKHHAALVQALAGSVQPAITDTAPASSLPTRAATINVSEVTLRRAKREHLQAMAELIATSTNGAVDPEVSQMMEALFSRAYLVALYGDYVIGVAGWQTENLIAGLQDFYVLRDNLWPTVGKSMLDKIHEEVSNLSCEVAMAFVLKEAGPKPIEFFEGQGYEQSESKNLGYMWKDAAMEWQPENSILLYKKLREQRIMVPM